jgi:hypothetical protein
MYGYFWSSTLRPRGKEAVLDTLKYRELTEEIVRSDRSIYLKEVYR